MSPRAIQKSLACCLSTVLLPAALSRASICTNTSTGRVPINDLGAGLYLGQFQGGLYPGGANAPPAAHDAEGLARALAVEPLSAAGNPDPNGRYALLSIGMSNTTQEFCSKGSQEPCDSWTFMGQAAASPQVNHTTLAIVNGARGGQAAPLWTSPTSTNYNIVQTKLAEKGLTEAQVQIIWIKQARPTPTVSLPDPAADAFALEADLGDIVRAAKVRYPNLKIVFFSSRIYAGYASTPLNPEPFAYETAFAVKWLIEAQIDQMAGGPIDPIAGDLNFNTVAPWLAWGPYLWADGLTPRSDGLIWECVDMESDGTHPATSAETKVGTLLLNEMLTSAYSAPWFAAPCPPGDPNGDGLLDGRDIHVFVRVLLGLDTNPNHVTGSDLNCDGEVGAVDLTLFVNALLA
ncbi:MAG: dockerin type I domain-containing protein [Phycisphaerae bacterium]